jgi:hypothetical protein
MADFNWNEFGAGVLGGIASALSEGDDQTQSPVSQTQVESGGINTYLPYILLAVGGVIALKALKVI